MKFFMMTNQYIIWCLLGIFCSALAADLKICAKEDSRNICDQLGRNNEVDCTYNLHGIDCLLNIESGVSSFGRVTAEEAAIASSLTNNVVVLGQIRDLTQSVNAKFETVVLVRKDTNGFKGLKGKKFCYPGYGKNKVTRNILNSFEEAVLDVIEPKYCDLKVDSATVIEKHLKGLNDFFGDSCRPGAWVDDSDFDKILKQRYPKLCKLCRDESCSDSHIISPFNSTIDCLLRNGGDVAITTLDVVKNRKKDLNEFGYLCKNERVLANLDDTSCIWNKQSFDLIVAHRDKFNNLKQNGQEWFKEKLAGQPYFKAAESTTGRFLVNILFKQDGVYEVSNDMMTLKDYFQDSFTVPPQHKCGEFIRWCVLNEELGKCNWLKQATLTHAIYPGIECVESDSRYSCIDDILKEKADIVTISGDKGFAARRSNLESLAFPETQKHSLKKSILVVKGQSIKSFNELKGKKGCFSEYGNIAWMSWLLKLQEENLLSSSCDYGKVASDFLGDSCAPGVKDTLHRATDTTDNTKLCQICSGSKDPRSESRTASNCNSDDSNEYYNNSGAIKCLNEVGDFAVLSTEGVDPDSLLNNGINVIYALCRNNSLARYPGLEVDDDCYLSTTVQSEIVVRRNDPKINNMKQLLYSYEKQFGQDFEKSFEIFNIFNNTKSLLFLDSTPGLDFSNTDNYVMKYLNIFKKYDACVKSGRSSANVVSFVNSFMLLAIAYFLY